MSNYNPQWAEQPQFNQPRHPKKKNGWKVLLGTVAGAVVLGTGIAGGMALQGPSEPAEAPTVVVTETAAPSPEKTVTAAPEPAPTVTVTEKAPSDLPPEAPEPQNAYDIGEEFDGCSWVDQSTEQVQILEDTQTCLMQIHWTPIPGYDKALLKEFRNDPEYEAGFGYMVMGNNWVVVTIYEADASAVADIYGVGYENL
jgi:hypothetical protein